jgi:SAM-dependent methyltransferase
MWDRVVRSASDQIGCAHTLALSFIEPYRSCPLCGHIGLTQNSTMSLYDASLTWDRCTSCSLVFQNPRLSEASLRKLYATTDYFGLHKVGAGSAYSAYTRNDPIRIKQGRRRMARITQLTGLHQGQLLDVGSASGFFGVAAREAGFDVACIEPDAELAAYGRRQYGLRFISAPLEACTLDSERYDLITIWGTDSHFLHPLHSFKQLIAALKPDGVLSMNYQNFDHWIRYVFPSLKTGWNVIYNLTDRSLDTLTAKIGLSLIARELEWQTVTIDHVARVLRVPAPAVLRSKVIRVPAVSLRFAVFRKDGSQISN